MRNTWSVPILRFAACTVPSAFAAACRRAGSPTSSCPSLVNATYDGKALPPTVVPSALGMMPGRPLSTTAAAELDVPRSIPMTLAMMSSFLCNQQSGYAGVAGCWLPAAGYWFFRNFDERGANQTPAQRIPCLNFLDHRVLRLVVALHLLNDFVPLRIEGLAQRVQPLKPFSRQEFVELPVDELDAGHHWVFRIVIFQILQRRIETINDRQERQNQTLRRPLGVVLALALHSFFLIF